MSRAVLHPTLRECRAERGCQAEPGCRAAITLIALVALLASPFIALVPAVAHRLSHGGARHVASATALLTTAQGLGAVIGALMIAPLALRIGNCRVQTLIGCTHRNLSLPLAAHG